MKILSSLIFFLVLAVGGGWAAGYRVQPQAIFSGNHSSKEAPVYKMTFRSGQVMVAKLLEDKKSEIKVELGSNSFDLFKGDLADYHPVTNAEKGSLEYDNFMKDEKSASWITYSREKNLFLKSKKLSGMLDAKKNEIAQTVEQGLQKASESKPVNGGKMALYESIVRKNADRRKII